MKLSVMRRSDQLEFAPSCVQLWCLLARTAALAMRWVENVPPDQKRYTDYGDNANQQIPHAGAVLDPESPVQEIRWWRVHQILFQLLPATTHHIGEDGSAALVADGCKDMLNECVSACHSAALVRNAAGWQIRS